MTIIYLKLWYVLNYIIIKYKYTKKITKIYFIEKVTIDII